MVIMSELHTTAPDPSGLLLVGDPHGSWDPIFSAFHQHRPAAVILLGDLGLTAPLRQVCAPILAAGARLYWIPGNHDTGEWDRLWGDAPDWNLHGRSENVAGRRVCGLGGIFRGAVWYPKEGDEAANVRSKSELAWAGKRGKPRPGDGVPMQHRDTIFPEDIDALRGAGRADILVCHEAPTGCVKHTARTGETIDLFRNLGFGAIDDLARNIQAKLVVYGHHHHRYDGRIRDGIRVLGLAKADCYDIQKREVL